MLTLTNGLNLTPTEKRFLNLLKDGMPHHRRELHGLLWDEQAAFATVNFHLCLLRKKLKGDLAIICELHKRSIHYRLVKTVGAARKSKRLEPAS